MASHLGQIESGLHAGLFRRAPHLTPASPERERVRPEIQVSVDASAQPFVAGSLIRQMMASLGFEEREHAPPQGDSRSIRPLRMTIAADASESPPPTSPLAQDQRGTLYSTSGGWQWHGPPYHLKAQTTDPSIRVGLHASSPAPDLPQTLAYAVRHAVTSMLPHTGWIPLHGAALEAPGGDGVLLVGDSGSGKSTLSAGLVLRGWACVSDDLLLLPFSDSDASAPSSSASGSSTENNLDGAGAIRVEGLTTDLRLCPDARERLHDALAERTTPVDPDAPSAPYGADNKSGYVVSAHPATRPTLVVLPSITDDPVSHLEPVPSSAGLRAVLEQMPPIPGLPPALARRVLQTAGDLIRPCSCVRLYAGRDLYDDPGRLADLLAPRFK